MARFVFILLLTASLVTAQQVSRPDVKVRVNVINVCTPSETEQHEIAAALAQVPATAHFSTDFEVARGRTSTPDAPASDWVRMRRDFESGILNNVQYSFSVDRKGLVETGVFRWRDPKPVLELSIEDTISAGTPAAVLATDTPADHIRVNRLGKSSLVVARCPQVDQHSLEPLFATASAIMMHYRAALGVRQAVPAELIKLGTDEKTLNAGRK